MVYARDTRASGALVPPVLDREGIRVADTNTGRLAFRIKALDDVLVTPARLLPEEAKHVWTRRAVPGLPGSLSPAAGLLTEE